MNIRGISLLIAALIVAQSFETIHAIELTPKMEAKLLNRPDRPTMEETYKAFGGIWPGITPFKKIGNGYVAIIENNLPRVIAELESKFPGATFAPLGRDAALFGDALDAFYTSIGQPGRVVHLNASGGSFGANDKMMVEFLKTNGLKTNGLPEKPFVMLDYTSYSERSQSTRLMQAIYRRYRELGIDFEKALKKVNFVSLNRASKGQSLSQWDFDALVKAQARNQDMRMGPRRIPHISGEVMTYSTPWHNPFRKLKPVGGGRVVAEPGGLSSLANREKVITQQIQIANEVTRPEFLASVRQQAKSMGYPFPVPKRLPQINHEILTGEALQDANFYRYLLTDIKKALDSMPVSEDTLKKVRLAVEKDGARITDQFLKTLSQSKKWKSRPDLVQQSVNWAVNSYKIAPKKFAALLSEPGTIRDLFFQDPAKLSSMLDKVVMAYAGLAVDGTFLMELSKLLTQPKWAGTPHGYEVYRFLMEHTRKGTHLTVSNTLKSLQKDPRWKGSPFYRQIRAGTTDAVNCERIYAGRK